MKKLVIVLAISLIFSSQVFAVGLGGGLNVFSTRTNTVDKDDSDGRRESTHTHVTTTAAKIYTIIVTPSSANGFCQIFETQSPAVNDIEYVQRGRLLADIQGATANNSIKFTFENGIAADRIFVDTYKAYAEIYYRN